MTLAFIILWMQIPPDLCVNKKSTTNKNHINHGTQTTFLCLILPHRLYVTLTKIHKEYVFVEYFFPARSFFKL